MAPTPIDGDGSKGHPAQKQRLLLSHPEWCARRRRLHELDPRRHVESYRPVRLPRRAPAQRRRRRREPRRLDALELSGHARAIRRRSRPASIAGPREKPVKHAYRKLSVSLSNLTFSPFPRLITAIDFQRITLLRSLDFLRLSHCLGACS